MILFDYDKAVHLMSGYGIDILLPHTILNAGYLSDHWKHDQYLTISNCTTLDKDETYTLLVGLPVDKYIEPFITCRRASEEGDMYNWDAWIKDKKIWGPNMLPRSKNSPLGPPCKFLFEDPFAAAAAAIKERKLERSNIGIELSFMNFKSFQKLKNLLPDARFIEAGGLFLELRLIKTSEEIKRIAKAAEITQNALTKTINSLQTGMSGTDILNIVGSEHYRLGGVHEWLHTQIGPAGIDLVGPGNKCLIGKNQAIRLDTGCNYRQYQSDISVIISVGKPHKRLLRAHKTVQKATEEILGILKPGTKVSDIFNAGNSVLEIEKLNNYCCYVGHGIGRNVHEEPILDNRPGNVISSGMTIAVEIVTTIDDIGMIGFEDNYVITDTGYKPLSSIGSKLHTIDDLS